MGNDRSREGEVLEGERRERRERWRRRSVGLMVPWLGRWGRS